MLCVLLLVILMRAILESLVCGLAIGVWGRGARWGGEQSPGCRLGLLITCPAYFLFPLPWVLCASDKSCIPQKER